MIAKYIFWISIFLIFYVYVGYCFILKLFSIVKGKLNMTKEESHIEGSLPFITIIITAFNEEKVITKRIDNLLSLNYPKNKIEIIFASDGSTDNTVQLIRNYKEQDVKLYEFKQNRGRALVHNDIIKVAIGNIIIFSDADSIFEPQFLTNIISKFKDTSTGCVVGNLVYKTAESVISKSEGFYWKYEKQLRKYESDLGLLATATGACTAIRRNLWKDISATHDVDFITPLDIILQGFKVVFETDAIAFDTPASSVRGELKTRIRQTSRNLVGTLERWGLRGIFKHPIVSFGLFSHKILRWFSPYFMLFIFLTNIFMISQNDFFTLFFIFQIIFYLFALIGFLGDIIKLKIPLVSTIYSFCVANLGMAIGIAKALLGKVPVSWQTH